MLRTIWIFGAVFDILFGGVVECLIAKQIDQETKNVGEEGVLNCTIVEDRSIAGQRFMWQRLPNDEFPDPKIIAIDENIVTRNPLDELGVEKYRATITSSKNLVYSLRIRRLVSGDVGEYRCTVMVQGWIHENYPSVTGKLVVQLPPGIDDTLTDARVEILEGSDAVLKCDASGVPPPTITWTRANGKALPNGMLRHKGTSLVIPKADDVASGIYRCTAENGVKPPEWRDIPLAINHPPKMRPFRTSQGQAPDKNFDIEMACIASGYPKPDLLWYKDGAHVTDDYKHEIHIITSLPGHGFTHGSVWFTLRVMNIQAGDYGNYSCLAVNKYGKTTAQIKLYYTPTCQGYSCHREYSATASAQTFRLSRMLPTLLIYLHVLLLLRN